MVTPGSDSRNVLRVGDHALSRVCENGAKELA